MKRSLLLVSVGLLLSLATHTAHAESWWWLREQVAIAG